MASRNRMYMESSPLNKAHEAGRRAVRLLKKDKFDEARACHLEAVEFLQTVEKNMSADSPVLLSIQEQTKYHQHQADLCSVIQKRIDEKLYNVELNRKISEKYYYSNGSANYTSEIATPSPAPSRAHSRPVVKATVSNYDSDLDEADSLMMNIMVAIKKTPSNATVHFTKESPRSERKPSVCTIKPRSYADIIEEAQLGNSSLRNIIESLMNDVMAAKEENKRLRGQLQYYRSQELQSTSRSLFKLLPPKELPELPPLENPPDYDDSSTPLL